LLTGRLLLETPSKPLDLTACIDESLLAGEERVALGAQIDSQAWLSRPGGPGLATGAVYRGFNVVWMDACFHAETSAASAGYTLTCLRSLLARSNLTVPFTVAKRV
jgi:hypothetical protein